MEGKNDIILTLANIQDIETLIQYRIKYFEATDKIMTDEEKERLAEGLRNYFSQALPSEKYVSYIAYIGSDIAGVGGMAIYELPGNPAMPMNKFGYILNMYTRPEFRGNGVCTSILNGLAGQARRLGLSKLDLLATEDGYPVYIKYGFEKPHCTSLTYKL